MDRCYKSTYTCIALCIWILGILEFIGTTLACPLLVIYGAAGLAGKTATPLDTWSTWGDDVSGAPVDAGHFMVEENPAETLRVLLSFLCEGVC